MTCQHGDLFEMCFYVIVTRFMWQLTDALARQNEILTNIIYAIFNLYI